MKKILLVLLFVFTIVLTGCGSKTKYESIMQEYAKQYYELHQKDVVQDTAMVTIEMLEIANTIENGERYDLSKLTKCSKDSSVDMILDKNTKKIEKYQFNLKCE